MMRVARSQAGAVQVSAVLGVLALAGGGLAVGYGGQQSLSGDDAAPVVDAVVSQPLLSSDVPVFDCPQGTVIGVLNHGDRVLASAVHDEVDGWVRVRDPETPTRALWIRRPSLTADDVGSLPTVACGDDAGPTQDELAIAPLPPESTSSTTTSTTSEATTSTSEATTTSSATSAPSSSTTTSSSRPTTSTSTTTRPTSTTKPTTTTSTTSTTTSTTTTSTTTTTTEPPDTTPPTIGTIGVTAPTIWEDQGSCSGDGSKPKTSSIVTSASDDGSGLASVQMLWSISGGGGSGSKSMFLSGGFWRATLGPFAEAAASGGSATITVTVKATDVAGNVAQKNASVTINDCTFG